MEDQNFTRTTPVYRSDGVNTSERYLKKLCERSFLSLWSYPSLTRDQGRKNKHGDGKELCDLLVVFGNDVIIFQDKECAFGDSGDLQLDWNRWYRAAIQEGAKQIWGAERWIKENPDLIFLDRLCTQPFPFDFPEPNVARYHRIIVAHGASERCKQLHGGSGSLMIVVDNAGPADTGIVAGKTPFTTGQIDPVKGFVHIFDDTTLDIILQTLDTVNDFVTYLAKKEAFVSSSLLAVATGEEELLALYLTTVDASQEHDFVLPPDADAVAIYEGHWADFCQHPQRIAQIEANEISYVWDELIEEFNKHNLAGTQDFVSHSLKEIEIAVRFLASENRTSRRVLAQSLFDIISNTASTKRAVRVIKSVSQRNLYYVLMVLPRLKGKSEEEYRVVRRLHLMQYCMVSKLQFPDAKHIVGVATDSGIDEYRSEDLVYYDATNWSEEEKVEAEQIREEFNLLNSIRTFRGKVQEYPEGNNLIDKVMNQSPQSRKPYQVKGKVGRNALCPCGSGYKFKRCHGN